ncbi:hypothetical protein BC829DRAFT_75041 [Chytridium lagenaria]|nr:hypothetical protein BC829DRAFT_75041 [Chytridium lagenaria]
MTSILSLFFIVLCLFFHCGSLWVTPRRRLLRRRTPLFPINPYGDTKLAIEFALKWVDEAHGIKYVCSGISMHAVPTLPVNWRGPC